MGDSRERPGVSWLAMAAAGCSIITLWLLAADTVFHLQWVDLVLFQSGEWSTALILAPGFFGLAATVRIASSRGKVTGLGFALLGIVTTALAWWLAMAYAMSLLAWGTT
jgi:hypothetical protein